MRSCEVTALVDTGATRSVIPLELARELDLVILSQVTRRLADGSPVTVGASSPIIYEIEGRRTCEEAYVMGNEVLIGQTVLETTDLRVDFSNCKVIPKHAEGPVFRL